MIGGLVAQGVSPSRLSVVEPLKAQRDQLMLRFQIEALEAPSPLLQSCHMVVWAVKPQLFAQAAAQAKPYVQEALHLSVAAGIRTDSLRAWLESPQWIRAMPNTPALVGMGITGLFACPEVAAHHKLWAQAIMGCTGQWLWVPHEGDLDAVTALSGSGPAYVFYFLEAMRQAGTELGLDAETATRLAIGTFVGASHLAQGATEPPEVLRERVTSKGGTTHAALTHMAAHDVGPLFVQAMHAAHQRAGELGDAFGR